MAKTTDGLLGEVSGKIGNMVWVIYYRTREGAVRWDEAFTT
jgi:hypothetical protein